MELSEMDTLKKTLELSVEDWYMSLPLESRKKVKRLGNASSPKDDFYPDVEYD